MTTLTELQEMANRNTETLKDLQKRIEALSIRLLGGEETECLNFTGCTVESGELESFKHLLSNQSILIKHIDDSLGLLQESL